MTKTFAETYTMRSRHYQLLGEIGRLMADAFMEADQENQRDIRENAFKAMSHYLIEHCGYNQMAIDRAVQRPGVWLVERHLHPGDTILVGAFSEEVPAQALAARLNEIDGPNYANVEALFVTFGGA